MGSNPTLRTKTKPTTFSTGFDEFGTWLREKRTRKGYLLSETTIKSKLSIIKTLTRRVNLWDIDEVEKYINNSDCSEGRKENMAGA